MSHFGRLYLIFFKIFNSFSVVGMIFSVLMILSQLLIVVPHIKDIDAEPDRKKVKKYSNIGFALYFVFLMLSGVSSMKMGDDYKYDEIELEYFAITRDNYFLINVTFFNLIELVLQLLLLLQLYHQ